MARARRGDHHHRQVLKRRDAYLHPVAGHLLLRVAAGGPVARVSRADHPCGPVIDGDDTPRKLVFDVAKIQGVPCSGMPVRDRYACLQQKLAAHPGPICTLQWVGECKVLAKEMGSGKFKVPHAIRGVMSLQSEPGRVVLLENSSGGKKEPQS
jgi:hypothetical protein